MGENLEVIFNQPNLFRLGGAGEKVAVFEGETLRPLYLSSVYLNPYLSSFLFSKSGLYRINLEGIPNSFREELEDMAFFRQGKIIAFENLIYPTVISAIYNSGETVVIEGVMIYSQRSSPR